MRDRHQKLGAISVGTRQRAQDFVQGDLAREAAGADRRLAALDRMREPHRRIGLQPLEQALEAGVVAAIDDVEVLRPPRDADEVGIRQRAPLAQQPVRSPSILSRSAWALATFAAPKALSASLSDPPCHARGRTRAGRRR